MGEEMSFSQHTRDTINGWGSVFRFVTPVMITIVLFILAGLKDEIKEVRNLAKELAKETMIYNTNHLSHHTKMEISFSERLAIIETEIKRLNQ
jgi:hypothetical protein